MTHTQQIIEGLIALGIKKPTKFTQVKLYGKLVHDISNFFSECYMYVLFFYLITSSANTFILVTEWKMRFFTEYLSLLASYVMLLIE